MLVPEERERAIRRGAKIYGELVGYGATSDGFDMVAPSGEGAVRCMRKALEGYDGKGVGKVDYINPHGTGTPVGDEREIGAIREVFGNDMPPISSTKSLTGHSLGAIGAQEAIFSLLMLNNGFICEAPISTRPTPPSPACRSSGSGRTRSLTVYSNSWFRHECHLVSPLFRIRAGRPFALDLHFLAAARARPQGAEDHGAFPPG